MNKPKFNVGDEVRVEFIGKITKVELQNDGEIWFMVDTESTYANRVNSNQMTALEIPLFISGQQQVSNGL